MVKLVNRAKMKTATEGTGTITLGDAVPSYQTFSSAGVANNDVVRYVIEDGLEWEIGTGVYDSGTLTRVVSESSNEGDALSLSGNAEVFITATADDLGAGGAFYETTLESGDWSGDFETGYVATKAVEGIKEDDNPIIDIDLSDVDYIDIIDYQTEFSYIYRVEASDDDELKFYSTVSPEQTLKIMVKV